MVLYPAPRRIDQRKVGAFRQSPFEQTLQKQRSALPPLSWPILLATLLCGVVLTPTVKMGLIRKARL